MDKYDEFREFIRNNDSRIENSIRDAEAKRKDNTEESFTTGTIPDDLKKTRVTPHLDRRIFLFGGIFSVCSLAKCSLSMTNGITVNALYDVGKPFFVSEEDFKDDLSVSREFIERIAKVPYPSCEVGNITAGTFAEQSILRSLTGYRGAQSRIKSVIENNKVLSEAAHQADDENIRAIILARAAIDRYSICDTDGAAEIISSVNTNNIDNNYALTSIMEYGSSISNNNLLYSEFIYFDSDFSKKYVEMWNNIDFDIENMRFCVNNTPFGISLSSAIQAYYMKLFRLKPNAETARDLHFAWFDSRYMLYKYQIENYITPTFRDLIDNNRIAAEDFIFSMTRLAYHMCAWNNYSDALNLLIRTTIIDIDNDLDLNSVKRILYKSKPFNFRWAIILREFISSAKEGKLTPARIDDIFGDSPSNFEIFRHAKDRVKLSIGESIDYLPHATACGTRLYSAYIETLRNIAIRFARI